jgi:S-adenosyl-l-methionine hydroxide adenosyltransferase
VRAGFPTGRVQRAYGGKDATAVVLSTGIWQRLQVCPETLELWAAVGNPRASAYLLAAYASWFPAGTVFVCVVDPGIGGARPAIILEVQGSWYVGPSNGLFELVSAALATGVYSAQKLLGLPEAGGSLGLQDLTCTPIPHP